MSNLVITAAQHLKMTEADLFRSVFAHRGLPSQDLWRTAYATWCERDELPRNGYENWFLDTCLDIVNGKLVLYPINDTDYTQSQYRIESLIEVKPNFDSEDDGN